MKITDAWVDDPTLEGELERPVLCVEVDQLPDVSIEPSTFEGGWSVGKYGPFVKYWHGAGGVNAGDFNVRFRNRFPVVVDIALHISGEMKSVEGYSLNINRARQLIRKYDPSWQLQVNDRAAMSGSILWVPVQSNPGCRHWSGRAVCGVTPTRAVHVGDIDLPLCSGHMTEHNERYARRRLSGTSK